LVNGNEIYYLLGIASIPLISLTLYLWVSYTVLGVRLSRDSISDTIMLGIGGVGFVAIIKIFLSYVYAMDWIIVAVALSPIIEELIRDLLIYYVVRTTKNIRTAGFLSISVGGGFAAAESTAYSIYFTWRDGLLSGIIVALMRIPLILIGHSLFSLIFGILLIKKKPYIGFIAGLTLHILWNLTVINTTLYHVILLGTAYTIIWLLIMREIITTK